MVENQEFLPIGSQFGDYRIESVLSTDATGVVYLAESDNHECRVALRIIDPAYEKSNPEFKQNLIKDIERMLSCPQANLCAIYDMGRDPETLFAYVLMEWIPGGTLRNKLKKSGRYSIVEALLVIEKIIPALLTAESCNVVYRDITSDSILFMEDGTTPKLADYRGGEELAIANHLYLPPERVSNPEVRNTPALVYSLGVLLWEMLVGMLPTVESVKDRPFPNIHEARADVPDDLANLIERMTQQDPHERIQALELVFAELKRIGSMSNTQKRRFSARIKLSRQLLDDVAGSRRSNTVSVSVGGAKTCEVKPAKGKSGKTTVRRTFSTIPPSSRGAAWGAGHHRARSVASAQTGTAIPPQEQTPAWLYVAFGGLSVAVVLILFFSAFFYQMTFKLTYPPKTSDASATALRVPPKAESVAQPTQVEPVSKPKVVKTDPAKKNEPVVAQKTPQNRPSSGLEDKALDPSAFPESIAPELRQYGLLLSNVEKGEKSDAERAILEAVNEARMIDPDMRAYDLNGNTSVPGKKNLSGERTNVLRMGKVFLIMELLRKQCPSLRHKYALEKLKFVTELPKPRELSLKETVMLVGRAVEHDVTALFRKFGVTSGLE